PGRPWRIGTGPARRAGGRVHRTHGTQRGARTTDDPPTRPGPLRASPGAGRAAAAGPPRLRGAERSYRGPRSARGRYRARLRRAVGGARIRDRRVSDYGYATGTGVTVEHM